MVNRHKNQHGDPDVLFISRAAIAIALEDDYEGEGVAYLRMDKHKQEVSSWEKLFMEAQGSADEIINELKSDARLYKACLSFTWTAIAFGVAVGLIGIFA